MKKLIIALTLILFAGTQTVESQNNSSAPALPSWYRPQYSEGTYEVESEKGIAVQSTTVNSDKSITATFYNRNMDYYSEENNKKYKYIYVFKWYLSYKGKRVSDYYTEEIRCQQTASRTVYIWPDEVPSGNEKYVTVQLGLEPQREGIHVEVEHR